MAALVKENEMRISRQAVLRVSCDLLSAPDVEAIANPYHLALKLPANCRITGISNQIYFYSDEIAFRIESPDFVETEPCNVLPEVVALYMDHGKSTIYNQHWIVESRGYFYCWDGPAVETRRTYGPDGKEVTVGQSFSHHAEFQRIKVNADDWGLTEAAEVVARRRLEIDLRAIPLEPKHPTYPSRVKWTDEDGRVKATSVGYGVLPAWQLAPCWCCQSSTARRLPDGVAECQDCAEKSLL